MTNAVSTIDTRKFLKESVKSYIEEYKTERYERESKARNEARIEKNIQNILSEQTLSLDDIANGFSVDPFTGEKVDMTKVTPPPSAKLVAKGKTLPSKDSKTVPVVPTTAKDLKRTGKNALKGAALLLDPSKALSRCSDAYGMIGGVAGSIIGWNLEFIARPLLKAIFKMLKFGAGAGARVFKRMFKAGAEPGAKDAQKTAKPLGQFAKSVVKNGVDKTIAFGKYLYGAGKSILVIAVTLGLMAITVGSMQFLDFFNDKDKIGWMKQYSEDNQAIVSDGLSNITDFKGIGKTVDALEKQYKDFSIWDFCRWPSDESQQCFFAGVTAGISARMTLRLITKLLTLGIDKIMRLFTGAGAKSAGGSKEALEQANLKELSEEISKLKDEEGQLKAAKEATEEAINKIFDEGLEDGSKLSSDAWLINNAVDMFKPKEVVIDMINKNRNVFTDEVVKSLGSSKFKMGIWADDPRKGFRIIIDVADNASIDQKTLSELQNILDTTCLNRTKEIHNSLGESAQALQRNADFVAAKGASTAGKRVAGDTSGDVVEALRRTEIENTLKAESEAVANALKNTADEIKSSTAAVKESLAGLPDATQKALHDAFTEAATSNRYELAQFKELLKETQGLNDEIIEKFHKSQSEVAANANALLGILNARADESAEILRNLNIQGEGGKAAFGNFKQYMDKMGKEVDRDFQLAFEAANGTATRASNEAAGLLDDLAEQSKYLSDLRGELDKASKGYQKTFFGEGAAPNPNVRNLAAPKPAATPKAKPFASATANLMPGLRRKRLGTLFRNFKRERIEWPDVVDSLKKSKAIFGGKFEIPEELLAPNSALVKAFENSRNVEEFLKAAKEVTDKYNNKLLENKKGIKIMTESNIKELVKELFKENSGKGYAKYPYGSSVREEEEPVEDYVEEWKSLSIEVIRDETRGTAIEIAKILVQDLELFEDVLDLAGQNQSVGSEILAKLKQVKEKV